MKYYAVRIGRVPGIYTTWHACQEHVRHFPGAQFKSFSNYDDALAYLPESRAESRAESQVGSQADVQADTQSTPQTASEPSQAAHSPNCVDIWVNGACLHTPLGFRYGWAFVVQQDGRELHRESGNLLL